jgi:gliding motility-associated-like protein
LAQIYVPNSFTPNNDGVNDFFKVFTHDSLDFYEIKIYNSWGEMVWNTNNVNEKWSGGDKFYSQSNVFSYILFYQNKKEKIIVIRKGFITLVR